jgi:hypothetical protein
VSRALTVPHTGQVQELGAANERLAGRVAQVGLAAGDLREEPLRSHLH